MSFQLSMLRIRARLHEVVKLLIRSDRRHILHRWRLKQGGVPDLVDPKTFAEKLQWMKLNLRHPLHVTCSDKLAVRDYVRGSVGAEPLVPLLGVYEDGSDLPFDLLPDAFVIKASHGSGWVRIVRDKDSIDRSQIARECNGWLAQNYWVKKRERNYQGVPPRLVVEELLLDDSGGVPSDYKIYCFDHGREMVVQVDSNRFQGHNRDFFSDDWTRLEIDMIFPRASVAPEKPESLERALSFARTLSSPFPFVRVDFYLLGKRCFVGELTFYPEAGHFLLDPPEVDLQWGEKIPIP